MPQHRSGGARPRHAPGPVPGRLRTAASRLSPGRRGGHAREDPAPPHRRQDRPLRAMLMTPWLAAGAGVVVAAALALHVPHAELTYTPNGPGACSLAECGTIAGGTVAPAQPAGHGPAAELRQRKKHRTILRRTPGRHPARPGRLRVRYQTLSTG